uniref:Uncharacterized protein n=1 Tax=Heterorhabditis bacteriophora TaxID=37862 RepID=A0A1I7X8B9_HETBA
MDHYHSSILRFMVLLVVSYTLSYASAYGNILCTTKKINVIIILPDFKQLQLSKKAKPVLIGIAGAEDVCKTRILKDHQPLYGHINNGSRVEIQQDGIRSLIATFVECMQDDRPSCHGIDNLRRCFSPNFPLCFCSLDHCTLAMFSIFHNNNNAS